MIELLLQAERAMSVGLIDRAEVLYRQVAEADPQNSIAVVGLARVRLERGDEAGALELARRALAIDPENAAAKRMVERLEEVLAYRAAEAAPPAPEPVPAPEPERAEPASERAEPVSEPESVPERAAGSGTPGPQPVATPDTKSPQPSAPATRPAPPSPSPPPPTPKRRSWLARLFRRS